MDFTSWVLIILLLGSLLMISIGLITKMTGGLFWSRLPNQFLQDRYDPRFEQERKIGLRLSKKILKVFPPIALGLLLVLILHWLLIHR